MYNRENRIIPECYVFSLQKQTGGNVMEQETSVSDAILIADTKAQYNDCAKKILGEKIILAHILVNVAEEFQDMSPEEVAELIEDEPKISEIPLEPGKTNMPRIQGIDTNDAVPNEGTITFDIRFHVNYLEGTEVIKLMVGVEAQKDYYPGYDIVTRGIFYGARMISAQLNTEFQHSDYDNIKKVYSIWICMDTPKYAENTITSYHLTKENLVGNFPEDKVRYDLMNVVCICLSKELVEENANRKLHRLLGTVFSQKLKAGEKKNILMKEYRIPMKEELERSVNVMCNLADMIEEEAEQRGEQRGEELKLILMICRKLKKGKSAEQIAEELEEELEVVEQICEVAKQFAPEYDINQIYEARQTHLM